MANMISSWDSTRLRSKYHFDPRRRDLEQDCLIRLGQITPTWIDDLPELIARSNPANWETRGYKSPKTAVPAQDLAAEEYDLERLGADPKMTITHLNWDIPQSLHEITQRFALENVLERVHVQKPMEMWNLHIDKLEKWCPEDPSRVMRIMIQLTDWQPGQFWEYGNYHWNQWRAGDVTTFDWMNIPHSTANAGHHPRVTFQITGITTAATHDYLRELRAEIC